MSDPINDCLEWWRARLDALADLTNKVRVCYDDEDLKNLFTIPTERPYAGVTYDNMVGLLPIQSTPGQSHITGMMTQANFSIILCFDTAETGADDRPLAYQRRLLTAVMGLGMDKKGPNTRTWRFVAELSPGTNPKTKLKVWAQRWSIPLVMSPTNLGVRSDRFPSC